MNSETKIDELEQRVAELTALVERLTAAQSSAAALPVPEPTAAPTDESPAESPSGSRRNLLKLAGAAAAGTVAAVAANALPAAAATGDQMRVGQSHTTTGGDVTSLIGVSFGLASTDTAADLVTGYAATISGWDTSNSTAGIRAGVMGYSGPFFGGGRTPHGVFGVVRATDATGSGVYGRSESNSTGVSAGVRARSSTGPALLLEAVATGAPTTGTWTLGAVQPDTTGNLWYCVQSGTPGTWRKLAGLNTAGAFHAVTPGRVYDSRLAQPAGNVGTISGGQNRTISVKDRRDGAGAVDLADYVPAGATAVAANVTIQSASGAGFLAVNPGGNTSSASSTINWSAAGQLLANGVTLTLNANRELTVVCGGGGSTDFIVDISGYYL